MAVTHTLHSSTSSEETLLPHVEAMIDDIDSGKRKLTRHHTLESYLKHVDDILDE